MHTHKKTILLGIALKKKKKKQFRIAKKICDDFKNALWVQSIFGHSTFQATYIFFAF